MIAVRLDIRRSQKLRLVPLFELEDLMSDRSTQFLRTVRRWQPFLLLLGGVVWTVGTGLAAGFWTYHTFRAQQTEHHEDADLAQLNLTNARADAERTAAESRKLEAQRPFLQKKLDIYFEAVQVAGRLTDPALAPSSDVWKDNARRFWALRWSELEMVGDPGIRDAARRVTDQIIEVENDPARD